MGQISFLFVSDNSASWKIKESHLICGLSACQTSFISYPISFCSSWMSLRGPKKITCLPGFDTYYKQNHKLFLIPRRKKMKNLNFPGIWQKSLSQIAFWKPGGLVNQAFLIISLYYLSQGILCFKWWETQKVYLSTRSLKAPLVRLAEERPLGRTLKDWSLFESEKRSLIQYNLLSSTVNIGFCDYG